MKGQRLGVRLELTGDALHDQKTSKDLLSRLGRWLPLHIVLVPHHVIHHHLLHTRVPVHHVLALTLLLRGQVRVVLPPHHVAAHHATAHHVSIAHHAASAAAHHSRPPHTVHHAHSILHRIPMLLKQLLTLLGILGLLNFLHLRLHFLEGFLRLGHLLIELGNIWSLLLRLRHLRLLSCYRPYGGKRCGEEKNGQFGIFHFALPLWG